MRSASRWLLPAVLAAACVGGGDGGQGTGELDSDGDGLSDAQEAELGSDPDVADTDGDGLADGDEVAAGTDLLAADSDGDGYTDFDELEVGSDPVDPNSRIYAGGWPYYADKDALGGAAPEPGDLAAAGERFARIVLPDQFGDAVDVYDFYNDARPIVIDISAQWCVPCMAVATWLDGGEDPDGHGLVWPAGPAVVARGDVYWITVLGEDENHLPSDPAAAVEWAAAFPSDGIPVLADDGYLATDYVGIFGWPTLTLLEPDLTVGVLDRYDGIDAVLAELAVRYPQ